MKKISLISIIFLSIDLIVKIFIKNNLGLFDSINVIPNFFSIRYVQNTGAAFSILEGSRIFLIGISIFAIYLIYLFLIKNTKLSRFDNFCYGMLIGGILGNLVDRIIYGYVIDYLSFKIINYQAPIFNLADTFIVISVIIIVFKSVVEMLCKK